MPARSTRGQRGLATWLKHLENRSNQSPDPNDPVATDDFTSLWRELRSNTFAAETMAKIAQLRGHWAYRRVFQFL